MASTYLKNEDNKESSSHIELGGGPGDIEPLDTASIVYTSSDTRKLVRKLDLWLCPVAFVVYLITFIDRANVGNARVAGLEKDLHLKGFEYNISLSVFYVAYALWEIPSGLVCKWLGPKIWIPAQVLAFGIVCMCTGFIKSFSEFVALRVLLGLAEGGVLPALALLLSRFYTRAELVFRIAIFVSAASLAGAFGGLLASAFIAMGSVGSIGAPWRNIFIFEGVITILIAIPCYFIIPSEPRTASFLSAAEKDFAIRRLQQPGASRAIAVTGSMRGTLLKQAISAPSNWMCALGYLNVNVSVQGISLFLPTIIKSLYPGMSTVNIQLRTVPPFMVAFVFTLGTAYISKRLNQRGWVMMASLPFAVVGYVIFVATNQQQIGARYAGAFLCIMGAFPIGPFFLSWAANNAASDTERGIVTGMIPGIGQFGALIASWSYLPKDAPNYVPGNALNVGCASLCFCITAAHRYYCYRQNKLRDQGVISNRAAAIGGAEGDPDMSILGSQHPDFRYSY